MERNGHILVVDDEPTIRFTLELLLQSEGHRVVTAENGEQALHLLAQHSFDLLLLDLKMPGMNGLDLARQAGVLQPEAAICILTGDGILDDTLNLDGYEYLLKTSSPEEVLTRVTTRVNEHNSSDDKERSRTVSSSKR